MYSLYIKYPSKSLQNWKKREKYSCQVMVPFFAGEGSRASPYTLKKRHSGGTRALVCRKLHTAENRD